MFNFSEKLKIAAKRKGIRLQDVAAAFPCTRQNLSRRMAANSWTQAEAARLADLIGCEYSVTITDRDTGEAHNLKK